jgi:selenocysteine lyase/cysteine desulfurase
VPESVIRAVSQAMRVPIANRGGVFPASARAEQLVAGAREVSGALLQAHASAEWQGRT